MAQRGAPEVRRVPVPGWVVDGPVDVSTRPEDESEVGDVYFLRAENQYDVGSRTDYYRYLKRIERESGLQEGSQLTFSFDPQYQSFAFHRLRIHRNGSTIDRLPEQVFKVIQREEDHDRQLYDESLSVIAVLEDVRVGDVIEYAFSTTGENPVFEGRFYWSFIASYGSPVGSIFGRLRYPDSVPVTIRKHKTDLEPVSVRDGGDRVLTWEVDRPVPLPGEGGLPSYFNPWGWIEVSSWRDWNEVAEWAEPRYPVSETLPPELAEVASRLAALDGDAAKILGALRFAQDEVRYLGMFEGIHSHQPYPLETIAKRRFGDCKDKTLLLVSLLIHLGIDAWPALVNTHSGKVIDEWAASPHAFNHLVTVVRYEDRFLWLDPTNAYQRGRVKSLYFPDYGHALVLGPRAEPRTGLDEVEPQGFSLSKSHVREVFRMDDYKGAATVTVDTTYTGADADGVRANFAANARNALQRSFVNYYASIYEGVEAMKDFEIKDDEESNVIVVREVYRIPEIWKESSGNKARFEASFPSRYINDRFWVPSTRKRSMPYGIAHPVNWEHEIEIHLPDAMNEKPKTLDIADPAFQFHYEERFDGRITRLNTRYRSLSDTVEAEATAEYLANVEKARNHTNYTMWISRDVHEGKSAPTVSKGRRFNWIIAIVMIVALGGAILAVLMLVHFGRRLSPRPFYDPHLDGISGWLVLIAIGVWVRPIVSLFGFFNQMTGYDVNTWRTLTDESGAAYHELWAPIILFETLTVAIAPPFYILATILFHKRYRLFPFLMVGIFLFELVTSLILYFAACYVSGADSEVAKNYLGALRPTVSGVLIWLPYMLVSKRVSSTFRNGCASVKPPPLPVPKVAPSAEV